MIAAADEERIGQDDQRADPESGQACEGRFDVAFGAGLDDMYLQSECAGSRLRPLRGWLAKSGIARVDERGDDVGPRYHLVQLLYLLLHKFRAQVGHAGGVAARPGKAGDQPLDYGVGRGRKHDRDRRRRGLCRERRWSAGRGYHRDLPAHQLGRERRQPIVVTLRPAIFDRHVAAFDEA